MSGRPGPHSPVAGCSHGSCGGCRDAVEMVMLVNSIDKLFFNENFHCFLCGLIYFLYGPLYIHTTLSSS